MTLRTQANGPVEDMIWMAWFLTGNEAAAETLLQHVLSEGMDFLPPDLFKAEQARRLALVKAFDRLFVQNNQTLSPATSQDNPLWLLAPTDRAAFALRMLFHLSEQAAAAFLNLTIEALRGRIENAAATFVQAAAYLTIPAQSLYE